jgi:hypothetical protein
LQTRWIHIVFSVAPRPNDLRPTYVCSQTVMYCNVALKVSGTAMSCHCILVLASPVMYLGIGLTGDGGHPNNLI